MKIGEVVDKAKSPTGGQQPAAVRPRARPERPEDAAGFGPAAMPQMDQMGSSQEAPLSAPDFMPGVGNPRQDQPQQEQPPGGGTVDNILEFMSSNAEAMAKGPLVHVGLNALEQEDPNASTAAAGAFADWSMLGGFDVVAAGYEAANQWITEGADFSETYADKKDEINMRLAEDRIEFPGATMAGSIGGGILASIVPGGIANKAMRGAHWLTRGLVTAPLTGASEAALYRYNSDGTKDEIIQDAKIAAIASAMFGTALGGVGNRARKILGRNTTPTEQQAAKELLSAVNSKTAERGLPAVSAEQLSAQMKERGMEAVMADYYPDMLPMLRSAVAVKGSDGAKVALDLLASRNAIETTFPQAIDDVVAAPRSRSLEEFSKFIKARQQRLQPKYDDLFRSMEGVNFKVSGMYNALVKSFEDLPANDRGHAKAALSAFRNLAKKKAGKGDKITPRELHNVKQELYRGAKTRDAKRVYDQITEWIGERSPEYAKLSRTYANSIDQEKAYKSGYKYFTGKRQSSSDVTNFVDNLGSYAEVTAFANGARRKIAEDLNGKAPAAVQKYFVDNAHNIDKLRAAMGKERADKLLGATLAEVSSETVRRTLQRAQSDFAKPASGAEARKRATDAAIAAMSPGQSPGKIRAVMHTLLPNDTAQPNTTANLMGQFATAPLEDQPRLLRELEAISQKGLPNNRPANAAAIGGGIAGAVGAGPQAETMDDIANPLREYMQGLE